jgi:hypothetical protein
MRRTIASGLGGRLCHVSALLRLAVVSIVRTVIDLGRGIDPNLSRTTSSGRRTRRRRGWSWCRRSRSGCGAPALHASMAAAGSAPRRSAEGRAVLARRGYWRRGLGERRECDAGAGHQKGRHEQALHGWHLPFAFRWFDGRLHGRPNDIRADDAENQRQGSS